MTQTAPVTPAGPKESLWRNRNFMLLWFGQGAGTLGPRVALVALPLLALEVLHASTFQVSLLTSLSWLPYALLSLPAGVLAERLDQRKIMVTCDLVRLVLLASVPLIALAGGLTLWYLYLVVTVSGALTVLFTVAYRSQLPRLVGATQLIEGNAKLGMCESLAELAGPALGGTLVGLVGASRALVANVLTYAVSAVTLGLIRVPETEPRPAVARVPFRAAMGEGLTFVRRQPILRRLLWCTSVSNFFVVAASSIAVTFMLRTLHASPSTVGLVFTAGSLGGLATGALAPRISARVGSARVIWLAMLTPGPLYLLMPAALPGWGVWMYAAALAALSANSILFNTAAVSYRQAVCPPGLLSRVNAVYLWIAYGVIPLGSLFGGTLGALAGLRPALLVCALGMWSACLFVVFSPLRTMRDIPAPNSEGQ
ncbi:MFS transporter [Kitasatospora sp. MMS16-BH015]|uniref:MFS transporter n=1 Tax=Kitasatospora sp. MMS16-BH015 TaxID=2018025 RepID=UPI000CA0D5AA|nr:MFS transporter [Kitasatospora sp. MMS16-BH015]AUG77455.1 MFS transporter [Kitasatospora sp. MMS16-BH015]